MTPDLVTSKKLFGWLDDFGVVNTKARKWAYAQKPGGIEKFLFPVHGTRYLYRGQNRRYWSCRSSISRGLSSRPLSLSALSFDDQLTISLALIRAAWFCELVKAHPVLKWAAEHDYLIDRMAIAQHYGVPTGYIDLTESLEVAMFFASCTWSDGSWSVCEEGEGILYRIDWVELLPGLRSRIRPIGLQPFHRPYEQWAWTLEMFAHEDFEDLPGVEAVAFPHHPGMGRRMLELFSGGETLFPADPLARWARIANTSDSLPTSLARSTLSDICSDPMGFPSKEPEQLLSELEASREIAFMENLAIDLPDIQECESDWRHRQAGFEAAMIENTRVELVRTRKAEG